MNQGWYGDGWAVCLDANTGRRRRQIVLGAAGRGMWCAWCSWSLTQPLAVAIHQ